ncbi:VaFE repeat-containing surface-anchored protein, partial [Microbacterium sp.]|uniref:VaFE repeat-containing surface-anchored protein n=2 Tax=Microbacterium sp. TaxID=51671 RepID=UPI003F9B4181
VLPSVRRPHPLHTPFDTLVSTPEGTAFVDYFVGTTETSDWFADGSGQQTGLFGDDWGDTANGGMQQTLWPTVDDYPEQTSHYANVPVTFDASGNSETFTFTGEGANAFSGASYADISHEPAINPCFITPEPTIGTSLVDQTDGDQVLAAVGGTVVDTVAYTDLTPGTEYTVTGELMNKADGSSTDITGETTFTPTESDGTVDVIFDVPSGHQGDTLVAFERLFEGTDTSGDPVAVHEDIDDAAQTVTVEALSPVIGTSLVDPADGDRVLPADGGTVVDTVAFENLTPGAEYTLTGELMHQSDGSSTGITGETVFTPTEVNGTVDVTFTVPTGFDGEVLVAFEQLYGGTDATEEPIAVHEDIDDPAQTVAVETIIAVTPSIGTSLVDPSDGDRVLPADGGTVVDTIAYQDLTPGTEYTLTGELMRKSDGSGTGIVGSTTFAPTEPDGSIDVVFDVPGGFAGETLVAYERLFVGTDTTGEPVAVHEDIDDAAQTVTVESASGTKDPLPEPDPTLDPVIDDPEKPESLAVTGAEVDAGPVVTATVLALTGIALLAFSAIRRRRTTID